MIPKKGGCAPPNPAPIFFLFVAMQIERILDKKEKHATERNESSDLANISLHQYYSSILKQSPLKDFPKNFRSLLAVGFCINRIPSPK